MRALIACEFSGIVRKAFADRGHFAVSVDLLPAEDFAAGHGAAPDGSYHYRGDLLDFIYGDAGGFMDAGFDLMIAHPPCTFLSSSGLHWNHRRPGRAKQTLDALEFVRQILAAPIDRIGLENPTGCIGSQIRPADQYIQPYNFGHDASKKTGLWLKNLPPLKLGQYVRPRMVCPSCGRGHSYFGVAAGCECGTDAGSFRPRWANQTDSGQNRLGPSADRWALRSLTYPGIAAAMADQWGAL